MRDQLHKSLKPIKDKAGTWWLFFWTWPALLRECHGELDQLTSDLSMIREKFRDEQSRCEVFEKLANESREMASALASRASAEKNLSQNLSEELGNAKVQLQKSSEIVGSLENKIARMEMETERVKAELAKTQADLTRSGLESERETQRLKDARQDVTLLRELVHRMHRLDIPTRRGIKAKLANGNRLMAFLALLLPLALLSAPFPPPFFRGVYTTNTAAWANTNVISLSTTNATSKPLTNHYQDGILTLFGLEAGANITLTVNPSNIVITGAAGSGDAGGTNARQFGTLTLTNLSGTGAVTNVVSLSTTNATSKPITNHFENGILTLYGLEAGANVTLSMNESNIVIASTGGGSEIFFNANQFLPSATHTNIRAGALVTNTIHWQSNALLPALIATNQPGGTIDLVTMLTTNAAGLRVTSNGAVVAHGVIGSTTNSFEVRSSNNVNVPLAVTHSNTVRVTGPSQSGFGASLTIGSASGSSQNNIELYAGETFSGRWRSDSSGNQVVSAGGSGAFFFNTDSGSGDTHFQRAGVGSLWALLQSSDVAAWHGGTLRRGQITNVWDIWGRTNLWLTRTGLFDGIVLTNDIRFLGHNSTSNDVWACTNTVTGEGEWRSYGLPQLSDVADTMGVGVFNGDLLSFHEPMGLWTNNTPAASQFAVGSFPLTLRDGVTVTNPNSIGILHVTNKPGIDRALRFWNTNGLGYSEFGVVTQAWLPTNKFLFSITNPAVGEVFEIQSVTYADGVATVVITNGVDNSGGGGGLTTNANQFGASVELTIKSGALLTNMNFWGDGTNHAGSVWVEGDVFPEGVDHFLGSLTAAWSGLFTADEGVYFVTDMAAGAYTQIKRFTSWKPTNSIQLTLTNVQAGEVLKVQSVSVSGGIATILLTNGVDSGGGFTTNANQFGASTELAMKSGALLTNTLFYPSNLTGPATIHLATTAQVTNLTEWRSTNGFISISVSSNANAFVYNRLDMSNRVAFRTNNIDFRLPVYQAFTNALQTNLVLQLTNTYEGVTHRIDAYGAGRLGNGRTNAWQLFCTVASGTTIYWPPGTTNGNFDVLVNSNQVVSFTFMGGLGSTNILAAYRVLEGIGAN